VSLYVGLKFPQIYGRLAALSPSVWWNQRVMHRFAATVQVEPRPHIWLDIGTREGPQILRDVENFRDVLVRKGWQLDRDLHYERVEGAEHNEAAWSQRVGPVLQFLFPVGNKNV
jgi:enterochelin esterase-like enzyme